MILHYKFYRYKKYEKMPPPDLTLAKRPGRHRLQIGIKRVGIDIIEFAQRLERHHGDRRAIGALAAAQHGDELLGILMACQRTAVTIGAMAIGQPRELNRYLPRARPGASAGVAAVAQATG